MEPSAESISDNVFEIQEDLEDYRERVCFQNFFLVCWGILPLTAFS